MRANFLFEPMDFSYLTCSDDETDEVRQTQGFGV
jgi:hypothetical protein